MREEMQCARTLSEKFSNPSAASVEFAAATPDRRSLRFNRMLGKMGVHWVSSFVSIN